MEGLAYTSLFLIGLSYGATACMLSCMPFLSPILLANSRSVSHAMAVVFPFSIGRVVSYMLMAVFASISMIQVKSIINNPAIAQVVLGSATMLIAVVMFYRSYQDRPSNCSSSKPTSSKTSILGYFTMGLVISLNPCAPIMTLITAAANSSSIGNAAFMGLSFGLGAIAATILFYGFLISSVAREIVSQFSEHKRNIERIAALLLAMVAVSVFNGWLVL
ncbi:MAG: sulfite exporter TauE/SafE [Sulfurimonas sp.]|jgi:sulfite exporter TauE/SafE|uniref:urease accessory protein UreH domain-containing protein n=1 Tax=Sulfurimonas sp. TaxID=2022749 RepID=UPI0039E51583